VKESGSSVNKLLTKVNFSKLQRYPKSSGSDDILFSLSRRDFRDVIVHIEDGIYNNWLFAKSSFVKAFKFIILSGIDESWLWCNDKNFSDFKSPILEGKLEILKNMSLILNISQELNH